MQMIAIDVWGLQVKDCEVRVEQSLWLQVYIRVCGPQSVTPNVFVDFGFLYLLEICKNISLG